MCCTIIFSHWLSNAEHLISRYSVASNSVPMITDDFEDFRLLGYNAVSPLKVSAQRTTRRYILQDKNPHNHGCENLKSYTNDFVSEVS
jgi:hypothetical protein